MFEKTTNFLREKKNSLISGTTIALANKTLNYKIPGIGKITDIEIDSVNKSVYFDLRLVGETDIVRLHIQGYRIIEEENQKFLCWNKIITSKPWITLLIAKFEPERNKIVVSSTFAWLVDLLV
jgi:hypothetical protein